MKKLIYKRRHLLNILIYLPIVIALLTAFFCGAYYLIFCFFKSSTSLPISIFIISTICIFSILPLFVALIFFFGNFVMYPYIDKIQIEDNCLIFKVITHFYKSKNISIPINEIKSININLDIAVPYGKSYCDEMYIRIDAFQLFEIKDYDGGTILLDSILLFQDYLPDINYNKNYKTNITNIPFYDSFLGKLLLAIMMYAIFIPLVIYGVNIFSEAIQK